LTNSLNGEGKRKWEGEELGARMWVFENHVVARTKREGFALRTAINDPGEKREEKKGREEEKEATDEERNEIASILRVAAE